VCEPTSPMLTVSRQRARVPPMNGMKLPRRFRSSARGRACGADRLATERTASTVPGRANRIARRSDPDPPSPVGALPAERSHHRRAAHRQPPTAPALHTIRQISPYGRDRVILGSVADCGRAGFGMSLDGRAGGVGFVNGHVEVPLVAR
jgi:hypothetical protein